VVLRGVSGSYFCKVLTLRGKTVIGRGSECDVVLNEVEMSRRHALIENTPDGLRDRPANGTFNGTPVRDTILKPGDQLASTRIDSDRGTGLSAAAPATSNRIPVVTACSDR
jgi:hypothetical protein